MEALMGTVQGLIASLQNSGKTVGILIASARDMVTEYETKLKVVENKKLGLEAVASDLAGRELKVKQVENLIAIEQSNQEALKAARVTLDKIDSERSSFVAYKNNELQVLSREKNKLKDDTEMLAKEHVALKKREDAVAENLDKLKEKFGKTIDSVIKR